MNAKQITLACLWIGLAAVSANGAVWHVDWGAPPGGDGSSWSQAFNHVQDALAVAQAGDEIRVAEGAYRPDRDAANPEGTDDRHATFELISGVALVGGFAGYGQPDPDARDPATYETILSGDLARRHDHHDNSYHVITAAYTGAGTVLEGFTVYGGNAVWPDVIDPHGGGMYMDHATVTVIACKFVDNWATGTPGATGGGIRTLSGNLTLRECVFIANWAGHGGALACDGGQTVLRNSTFLGNGAFGGGAIWNYQANQNLRNCVFSGNQVFTLGAGRGGAIYNNGSSPNLSTCSLSLNSAEGNGGGILNTGGSYPVLTSCILWGNSDPSGTGIPAQIYDYNQIGGTITTYSCVEGFTGGGPAQNLGVNPRFVDANGPDDIPGTPDDNLRLRPNSSCIDAGDPAYEPEPEETDVYGAPRVCSGQVDMGASEYRTPGDIDGDCGVDLNDFATFALCFSGSAVTVPPPGCAPDEFASSDLDDDNDVDLADFATFALYFMG